MGEPVQEGCPKLGNYHELTMISRTLVKAQFEYWDDESVVLDLKGDIVRSL